MSKYTLATMYGTGLVGFAPGTAGSLVAALLAYPLLLNGGWFWLLLGSAVLTLLGTISSNRYMRAQNTAHDPSEIVVDEWAGQWLTYALIPVYCVWIGEGNQASMMLGNETQVLHYTIAGFVAFRVFDIVKPWPISLVDRKVKGGFGVMADDLVAALPAAVLLLALSIYSTVLSRSFSV